MRLPALVYMAPEALLSPDQITEAADVFSLGAIAYHLFSGHVPAANTLALAQTLRTQKGLKLSAVIDGVGPSLGGTGALEHPSRRTGTRGFCG